MSALEFGGAPAGLSIEEEVAFAFFRDGTQLLDILDPAVPVPLGSYSASLAYGGTAADAIALVALRSVSSSQEYFGRLIVLDVGDPEAPSQIGEWSQSNPACYDVQIDGSLAYVTNSTGPVDLDAWPLEYSHQLTVLDISDPTNPAPLGACDVPATYSAWDELDRLSLAVWGTHAYVAAESGLWVIDVSNPSDPRIVGHNDVSGTGIYVADGRAYLSHGDGISVIDVRDAADPREVSDVSTIGIAKDVRVSGEYVYVADGPGGISILAMDEMPIPVTPRSVQAVHSSSPPFLDGALDEWGAVPATILNYETARYSDFKNGAPPTWQDASLVLRSVWTDTHLYFGIQVNDDSLVAIAAVVLGWTTLSRSGLTETEMAPRVGGRTTICTSSRQMV